MGFAKAYLQRAGLRGPRVLSEPHRDLKIIVTLPVHNESGLERSLDSLFLSADALAGQDESSGQDGSSGRDEGTDWLAPPRIEVLILVNAAEDAAPAIHGRNLHTLKETQKWIGEHPHPLVDFHIWLDHKFTRKEAGVGLARKILMDEALRRFSRIENPDGIIASMDADAVVDPSYFRALLEHFSTGTCEGCSVFFEHPLTSAEDPYPSAEDPDKAEKSRAIYEAITCYELHLRYYVEAVRSTGYPNAYHTVGSAFAVKAGIYCKEGGMNRRKGGEDFYFIQKVAARGRWSECNTTRVIPSPRPSRRVPFGTGPVVAAFMAEKNARGDARLYTYNPESFLLLKELFDRLDSLYLLPPRGLPDALQGFMAKLAPEMEAFLEQNDFVSALEEIRDNSASLPSFRKRFWRWFNAFRIMKFLHFAREQGYDDVEVLSAAGPFLKAPEQEAEEVLHRYRQLQRS